MNQSGLLLFGILAVVGVIVTVLELIYYRDAFDTLEAHEARFSTPTKLVLLLLMALPILLLAALALVDAAYQAILWAGAGNPITSTCLNSGNILALAAVLGIVGIVVLIGYLGLLLGIWRLGTRYDAGAFKLAAVLLIFPVLNVIAAILILVSARSTRARIAGEGSAPTFG